MESFWELFSSPYGTTVAQSRYGGYGPVTQAQSGRAAVFDFLENDLPQYGASFAKGLQGFYQADMLEQNAKIASRNAELAVYSANLQATDQEELGRLKQGTIRSSFSKAGVVTTSGSPLLAAVRQARETADQATRLRQSGQIEAISLRNKARTYKSQAKQARIGAILDIGSMFIGG